MRDARDEGQREMIFYIIQPGAPCTNEKREAENGPPCERKEFRSLSDPNVENNL